VYCVFVTFGDRLSDGVTRSRTFFYLTYSIERNFLTSKD
jgi:hypothetical protein